MMTIVLVIGGFQKGHFSDSIQKQFDELIQLVMSHLRHML